MSNYNQAEFYFKRAETVYENKDYQKAIELYDKVINLAALEPNIKNDFLEKALIQRAFSYWYISNYPYAIKDCNEIIEFAPNNPWAWALRGSSYARMGKKEQAAEDLSIAFEIEPKDIWILHQIINFYLTAGEYQNALAYGLRLDKLQHQNPLVQFTLGNIYLRLGDASKALSVYVYASGLINHYGYRSPILEGKEEAWIEAGFGAVSRLENKLEEALSRLNESIKMYDGLGWVWAERGEVYRQQQKYPEAISDFKRAIDLDNFLTWIKEPLEDCLRRVKLHEAEAASRKIIKENPNNSVAYLNLGTVLAKQNRFVEAIEVYRQAIEKSPEDIAKICDELGFLLARQDNIPNHSFAYQQALKKDAHMGYTYYNTLGELFTGRKLPKNGEAAFRKAIEIDPGSSYAYHRLGSLLTTQNRAQEAEALYRQAIEKCSRPASAYTTLGGILRDQNHLQEAEAMYQHAILIEPDSIDAYNYLGLLLTEQKRFQEAEVIYRQAIEKNLENDFGAYSGLASLLRKQNRHEEAKAIMQKFYGE